MPGMCHVWVCGHEHPAAFEGGQGRHCPAGGTGMGKHVPLFMNPVRQAPISQNGRPGADRRGAVGGPGLLTTVSPGACTFVLMAPRCSLPSRFWSTKPNPSKDRGGAPQ